MYIACSSLAMCMENALQPATCVGIIVAAFVVVVVVFVVVVVVAVVVVTVGVVVSRCHCC